MSPQAAVGHPPMRHWGRHLTRPKPAQRRVVRNQELWVVGAGIMPFEVVMKTKSAVSVAARLPTSRRLPETSVAGRATRERRFMIELSYVHVSRWVYAGVCRCINFVGQRASLHLITSPGSNRQGCSVAVRVCSRMCVCVCVCGAV